MRARGSRPGRRVAAGLLVVLVAAGCADEASTILRTGACDRLQVLRSAAEQMGTYAGDERQIALLHQRVEEEADLSPEMHASRYGKDLDDLRDEVLRALRGQNVADATEQPGPDWAALAARSVELSDGWGCDET